MTVPRKIALYISVASVICSKRGHPIRFDIVSIFHHILYHKYLLYRDVRDPQCALKALFESLEFPPAGNKSLLGPFASISDLYLERFNRWRRVEDLQQAASWGEKALKLLSPDPIAQAYQLYLRAQTLARIYEAEGPGKTLQSALTAAGGSVVVTCSTAHAEADYMNVYANLLSIRAGRMHSHDDVEASLYWAKRALSTAGEQSLLWSTYAHNLSNRYYQRYKRKSTDICDLDKSIELQRALSLKNPRYGPGASSLARQLLDRYRDFGDTKALTEAVQIAIKATQLSFKQNDLSGRAKTEHVASLCLEALYERNHEVKVIDNALNFVGRAMTFLPKHSPSSTDISSTLSRLTRLKEKVQA